VDIRNHDARAGGITSELGLSRDFWVGGHF